MQFRQLALLGVVSSALAGCGGSSSDTVLPSLYAGTWSGNWSGPQTNDGGSMQMTVTGDGSVTGTMTRTGGLSGSVGGVINKTGLLTATAAFPSSGNFLMNGAVVTINKTMTGSFNYSWLGGLYQGSFSMTGQ